MKIVACLLLLIMVVAPVYSEAPTMRVQPQSQTQKDSVSPDMSEADYLSFFAQQHKQNIIEQMKKAPPKHEAICGYLLISMWGWVALWMENDWDRCSGGGRGGGGGYAF